MLFTSVLLTAIKDWDWWAVNVSSFKNKIFIFHQTIYLIQSIDLLNYKQCSLKFTWATSNTLPIITYFYIFWKQVYMGSEKVLWFHTSFQKCKLADNKCLDKFTNEMSRWCKFVGRTILSKFSENIDVHPHYITFIQQIFSLFEIVWHLYFLYAEISEALSLTFLTFLFFTLFDAASKSSAILE